MVSREYGRLWGHGTTLRLAQASWLPMVREPWVHGQDRGDFGMTPAYVQWWAAHQLVRLTVPGAAPPAEQARGDGDGVGDGGQAAMVAVAAQGAHQGPHGHRAVARRGVVAAQVPPQMGPQAQA